MADIVEGWAVVGNHVYHGPLREGAKCTLRHDPGLGSVEVLVAPKGRRWAAYWTRPDRLYDLRVERIACPKVSKLVCCIMEEPTARAQMARMVHQGARPRGQVAVEPALR